MEFEAVIGLEIHAQISTKTKMFVRIDNDSFEKAPNQNTSPFCFGMPGLLPVVNKEAVYKGLKAALALGCNIPEYSKFDRKNYFYPDNPKGFQISQFDEPLSENGKVEVEVQYKDGKKETIQVGITRLHLEDDAGKLTHIRDGSLVDYNRAGTPLMEIVSDPDLTNEMQAVAYAKEIQKIVRYVDSSDADMEKGMMRFDASVSIRPIGEKKLYPRAEIKNLNSFKALENAVKYEIKRQKQNWKENGPLQNAVTVGWDDQKSQTFFMRDKEESDDYRYFPEPDIPPIHMPKEFVETVRAQLPELPTKKLKRFVSDLKLSEEDARILSSDLKTAQYFEEVVAKTNEAKKAASFINNVLMKYLREELISIDQQKVTAEMMAELITLITEGKISNNAAKGEIFEEMYFHGKSPSQIVEEKGLSQVSDTGAIEEACKQVISTNPGPVQDIKDGKEKAIGFLIGQVMKAMQGKANPSIVNKIMKELITKN